MIDNEPAEKALVGLPRSGSAIVSFSPPARKAHKALFD